VFTPNGLSGASSLSDSGPAQMNSATKKPHYDYCQAEVISQGQNIFLDFTLLHVVQNLNGGNSTAFHKTETAPLQRLCAHQ
jgi:hypothetical protein